MLTLNFSHSVYDEAPSVLFYNLIHVNANRSNELVKWYIVDMDCEVIGCLCKEMWGDLIFRGNYQVFLH